MTTSEHDNANTARTLFVVRAGGRRFAVFAEEVEATAVDLTPMPLPFAPPAIRGVVSLRGRIRTVIDPLRLADAGESVAKQVASLDSRSSNSDPSDADAPLDAQTAARLFIALKGDEQLALMCDEAEEGFDISSTLIVPPANPRLHMRGTVEHGGSTITLLDPALLFDAAMRGSERRRKRS